MTEPFLATSDGIRIAIRLTPSSSADRIEGPAKRADGLVVVAVRVRAVPEHGRANRALESLLAKALRVSKSSVAVTGGTTSRLKQLTVKGDPSALLDSARRLWPSSGQSEGGS